MRRGRRWCIQRVSTGARGAPETWWWCAWRLFERVEGITGSEAEAEAAIDHFLGAKSTYSL